MMPQLAGIAAAIGSTLAAGAGAVGSALGSAGSAIGSGLSAAGGGLMSAFGAGGGTAAGGAASAIPTAAGTAAASGGSLIGGVAGGAAPVAAMPSGLLGPVGGMTPTSLPAGATSPTTFRPHAYASTDPMQGTSGMGAMQGPEMSLGMKWDQFKQNPWVKAGANLMSSYGGGGDGRSATPPVGGEQTPAQNFPVGPGPTPYRSGHVEEQREFARSAMADYLKSGGAFYG